MSAPRTIWLVTIQAHDGTSPGDVTLRYSDAGYVSKPGDSPANTFFEPRVSDPGSVSRTIFAGGTTFGRVDVGYGEIVLENPDGGLDEIRSYGFGREVLVESITALRPEAEAYSSAVTRFRGIVDHIEADFDAVRVILRDELGLLDAPLQDSNLAGSSTGATGIEGDENVEGAVKPMTFGGAARNIAPVLVNASKEVYAWNFDKDGATKPSDSVDALRNGGATYTLSGTDHAGEAALFAATVTAGQADTCLAESLLRVNGSVTAQITADVTVEPTNVSAAQVAKAILLEHGYTIDAASVSALDASNSSEVAVHFSEGTTILDAAQRALESIGGYLIATNTGGYKVGRFEAPSGTVRKAIAEWEILDESGDSIQLVPTDDGNTGIPVYKVTLSYSPNWTPQPADGLVGSVSQTNREAYSRDALRVVASDTAIQTQHPEAREVEIQTALVSEADASTEASRRLAFLKSGLTRFRVPLAASQAVWDSDGATPIDVGDYVTLTLSRFGFASPGDFVVIGVDERFADNVVTLDIINSDAW